MLFTFGSKKTFALEVSSPLQQIWARGLAVVMEWVREVILQFYTHLHVRKLC